MLCDPVSIESDRTVWRATSELSIEVSAVDRKNANHPLFPADGLVKPCSVITSDFKPECLVKNPDPLQMQA